MTAALIGAATFYKVSVEVVRCFFACEHFRGNLRPRWGSDEVGVSRYSPLGASFLESAPIGGSGQRPRVDGLCASRRRPRNPWCARVHGADLLLSWLGWQSCAACAARLLARLTHLKGGGLTFRLGRRPQILVRRPWSASVLPGAARVAGG
jgi:hypothetical protein